VKIGDQTGPDLIRRHNQYRTAEITGSAAPGFSSGDAMRALEELSAKLPEGYGYEWAGLSYQEKTASGQEAVIFGMAMVFVFLVLAALYESFAIPVGIILGLVFGVGGAYLGVFIRGLANDVYAQIGIAMLIGLVSKTSILIVEFAKMKHEKDGLPVAAAAFEGTRLRFRPILMTAFSFILGVVPLLLASGAGSASRWSLGTTVFAGMTVAIVISVFTTPAIYVLIEKLKALMPGKRTTASPEGR
jgi:HAE1 family hydrophobic/amphiphilic exporter-1/multidrug efflux pump